MRIPWPDFSLLEDAGFGLHEKRALVLLSLHGSAEARTLCREGDIPTSKIYLAMEKLAAMGLVEVQSTRPRLFVAIPPEVLVDRLVTISRQRADYFAKQAEGLRRAFADLPGRVEARQGYVDLAMGLESHVKRHLVKLSSAKRCILSYLEVGDLVALDRVSREGFDVLKPLAKHARKRGVEHRIVFGVTARTAPALLDFFSNHAIGLEHVHGVRYAGEMGHPFHVVDDELVILSLDHPFVPEGRFASLLLRDSALAARLTEGFQGLWKRALRDLREIRAWPQGIG